MKKATLTTLMWLTLTFALSACNNDTGRDAPAAETGQGEGGRLAAGEMYTCTMHNEVMSKEPGTCPKCNMKLTKEKMTAEQEKMMREGTYLKPKEEQ